MAGVRVAIIVYAIIVVALVTGVVGLRAASCHARWENSRNAEWGLLTGCLVETDGVLVPESRVWFERNQ